MDLLPLTCTNIEWRCWHSYRRTATIMVTVFSLLSILISSSSNRKWDKCYQQIARMTIGIFKMTVRVVLMPLLYQPTFPHFEKGHIEKLKYASRRRYKHSTCMDKVFMRGKDFNAMDKGNHQGQTHKIKMSEVRNKLCTKTNVTTSYDPGKGVKIKSVYLYPKYITPELYLIHMQKTSFEEWLVHAMRGSSDGKFNKFDDMAECRKGMGSYQYCKYWEMLIRTEFNPTKLKEIYRGVCKSLVRGGDPFPIHQLFIA